MTKLYKILSFITIIALTTTSSQANEWRFWTAYNGGSIMMTNYSVEEYITATNLSDEQMIQMFKEAKGDYNEYEKLRRAWAQKRFNAGLAQIAYVHTVKTHAKTRINNTKSDAFKVLEKEYWRQVEDVENKAVKKWLDQRLGIVKARIAFAQELKEIGYPHKENQDDTELFFEWFDLQKRRLKAKIRLEETQKYEIQMNYPRQPKFYIPTRREMDVADATIRKVQKEINQKRLSPGQLSEIITSDEKIALVTKSIELLGPNSLTLAALQERAPGLVSELKSTVTKAIAANKDFAQKVKQYIQAAKSVASSKTISEIEKSVKEARTAFLMQENDYTQLMKAKILELAIEIKKDEKLDDAAIEEQLKTVERVGAEAIATAFSNPSAIEKRLENYVAQSIGKATKIAKNITTRKANALANWVFKFYVKKASLEVKPLAVAEVINPGSSLDMEKLNRYLVNQEYMKKLEQFRRSELSGFGSTIRINPDGEGNIRDYAAWNWVLDQI